VVSGLVASGAVVPVKVCPGQRAAARSIKFLTFRWLDFWGLVLDSVSSVGSVPSVGGSLRRVAGSWISRLPSVCAAVRGVSGPQGRSFRAARQGVVSVPSGQEFNAVRVVVSRAIARGGLHAAVRVGSSRAIASRGAGYAAVRGGSS